MNIVDSIKHFQLGHNSPTELGMYQSRCRTPGSICIDVCGWLCLEVVRLRYRGVAEPIRLSEFLVGVIRTAPQLDAIASMSIHRFCVI